MEDNSYKNYKEFLNLFRYYIELADDEVLLEKALNRFDGDMGTYLRHQTGFGNTDSCWLCQATRTEEEGVNCNNCMWILYPSIEGNYPCVNDSWLSLNYDNFESVTEASDALLNRVADMKKILDIYDKA